jgi:hypothetical protein
MGQAIDKLNDEPAGDILDCDNKNREETLTKVNSLGTSIEALRRRLQAVEDVEGPSDCTTILKQV